MSSSIPLIVIDDSSDGSGDGSDDDSVVEVLPGRATSASAAAAALYQNVVYQNVLAATNQNDAGTHNQDGGDSASASAEDESSDGDEEIQDMGTTNAIRLPHARHDCPNRRFVRDVLQLKASGREQETIQALKTNAKTCDLCYCMLCDEPASECNRWSGVTITADSCHCLADRQGTDGPTWIALRAKKKGTNRSNTTATSTAARSSSTAALRSTHNNAPGSMTKKQCTTCQAFKSKEAFSPYQWYLDDSAGRRCKFCIDQVAPITRRCCSCNECKPRTRFMQAEWDRRGLIRQCTDCIMEEEARQRSTSLPPLPPPSPQLSPPRTPPRHSPLLSIRCEWVGNFDGYTWEEEYICNCGGSRCMQRGFP